MQSLMRQVEALAINSPAAVPIDGSLSDAYAIPLGIRYLSFSVRPVGTFDSISVSLQISNNNVTEEFTALSTVTAAGVTVVGPLASNFCRIKVNSSAGTERTGLVIGILGR
jgi:hypothetical protein